MTKRPKTTGVSGEKGLLKKKLLKPISNRVELNARMARIRSSRIQLKSDMLNFGGGVEGKGDVG